MSKNWPNHILIVGSSRKGALEHYYVKAMKGLGIPTVQLFDLERPISQLTSYRMISRITEPIQDILVGKALEQFLKESPPPNAIIVFKGMRLTVESLRRCKRIVGPNSTWINYNPDDPFDTFSRGNSNKNILSAIPQYDIYGTWTHRLMAPIRNAGCQNPIIIPFASDPSTHTPSQTIDLELSGTITFVGGWDRYREEMLSCLRGLPIRIFGSGWDRSGSKFPFRNNISAHNIYDSKLRRVITSSLASINVLRPQNFGSHNMRTFEIPAMGGVMLTDYSEDQALNFPPGKASLMFSSRDELRSKADALVSGAIDTQRIRAAGQELAEGQRYIHRAASLLDAVATFQNGGGA